eukprot:TRINITY_DN5523_c0_g2_i1.p1 TRINITY_DN5523_c0_g2~~TRINITY_DN5523_c0_g2_i1.p1  ORF type:complete len:813 (-),score=76.00 TRINITY_DN5523_c0_g2_i1:921-3359(-)
MSFERFAGNESNGSLNHRYHQQQQRHSSRADVVASSASSAVNSMPFLTAQGVMPLPRTSKTVFTSPGLSLALKSGGEGQGEGEGDAGVGGGSRDEEYESRSGSDNVLEGEGVSGDDDQDIDHPPRKKRYHRHTPQQIQELEALFKECPHPDENQRLELSRRLNLEPRQVKFWFQNRRTQMKTQLERHENSMLRQENEKLRAENVTIKEAMRNPICSNCGGPAVLGEMSLEEQQLRIENARLKEELDRLCALAGKFFGRPVHPSILAYVSASQLPKSTLDSAAVCASASNMNPPPLPPTALPTPTGQDSSSCRQPLGTATEKTIMAELAMAAMEEFFKMAQAEEPLWLRSLDTDKQTLNYEEYMHQFPSTITPKPVGFTVEATRDTGVVMIRGLDLVDTLMDVERWKEMFSCIISRAEVVEVISSGLGGTRNGSLQLMHAELQVLSPLVPLREVYFLRFCKQHAEGLWAVVDVSLNTFPDPSEHRQQLIKCRRFPSGCLIQEISSASSKVTWVEHAEYDERLVHRLYKSLLSSGMAYGAHRWLAILRRQCECLAAFVASARYANGGTPSASGRRSMLKLAQRMTDNFCAGVSASVHVWNRIPAGVSAEEDVRIMTRKSIDDPGEPPGVVLSAATSVWLPVSPHRLFQFLRDERLRSEWDILSNGGPMQEMSHISKGQDPGNCVSLLRANAMSASQNSMLILQETCTDTSGSLVVYAPVDVPAIHVVLSGGDPANVALLPSGFAILPDGPQCQPLPPVRAGETGVGGSLLTVAFQILVNSLPTAKINVDSINTVNNLITCTVHKIKAALHCEDA